MQLTLVLWVSGGAGTKGLILAFGHIHFDQMRRVASRGQRRSNPESRDLKTALIL